MIDNKCYVLIVDTNVSRLERDVSNLMIKGWEPLGSHQVITTRVDTYSDRSDIKHNAPEYSQAMYFPRTLWNPSPPRVKDEMI